MMGGYPNAIPNVTTMYQKNYAQNMTGTVMPHMPNYYPTPQGYYPGQRFPVKPHTNIQQPMSTNLNPNLNPTTSTSTNATLNVAARPYVPKTMV